MMKSIAHMNLREKIGQMLVTGFPGPEISPAFKEAIADYKIGNVILFSANIKDKVQLGGLVSQLQRCFVTHTGIPGFITIDQEGGRVTRLPRDATNVAGALAIASTGRPENAYAAGRITARELRALGINFNLAPVMDVNNNPLNPVINVRSYGDDAATVSEYGVQMMRGLLDGGVMSALKHFPGHGDTQVDSHIGLPVIEKTMEELEQLELIPFKAAIEQGAQAIMSAHILFPQIEKTGVPGTMSSTLMTKVLKEKLGFKGLVVSDCLEMEAIKRFYGTAKGALEAIKAGIDLVFISHTVETVKEAVHLIEQAVAAGDLDEAIIDAAVAKILTYKAQYAAIEEPDYELVGCHVHERANALMRMETICCLQGKVEAIRPGDPHVLFMGADAYRTDLASSSTHPDVNFAHEMGAYFKTAYERIDIDPDEEQIRLALHKAKGFRHVVFGLFNARENRGQLALVQKLLSAGHQVTAIALGRPYDLSFLTGDFCAIAAFEYTQDTFRSLQPILKGEVVPTGSMTMAL